MNIKRKLLSLVFGFFFLLSVWAQRPTKDFPYEYYNSREKSYNSLKSEYDLRNSKSQPTENKHPDYDSVTVYRSACKNTHVVVFKYKASKNPSERDIRQKLSELRPSIKTLDKKIDGDNGDMDVCFIFLDSNNNLICSAVYSENY